MSDQNVPQNTSLPEVSYANYTNPPQPSVPATPEVVMSTPQTLTNIFFEPTRTFTALRDRPRFLVAALITTLAFGAFYLLFINRVGYENIARARVEAANPDISTEDMDKQMTIQTNPIVKAFTYAGPLIGFPIYFALGGLLYLLGVMAMGKSMSFKQAVSVWTYSGYPPLLIAMLANILILFLKSSDTIDPAKDANGLVHANLSLLVDRVANPTIATLLGGFDLFQIFGMVLAAIGLRVVGKMSNGSAWTIVLVLYIIGVLFKVIVSTFTKTAM